MPSAAVDPVANHPASRHTSGALAIVVAYFLYALSDAAAKWLVAGISAWQILFVRSVVALVVGLALILALGRGSDLRSVFSRPWRWHLLQMNLANTIGWFAYYSAAADLHLSQLYMMYYVSPMIATLLAIRLLSEPIPASRWLATGIGFTGIMVALSPIGPLPTALPAVLGLLAALSWAYASVLYRRHVAAYRSLDLLLLSNLSTGLFCFFPAAWGWQSVGPFQWALLAFIGVVSVAAFVVYLTGIRRVPVSVAGPIGFTSLLWSIVLGKLIWNDIPSPSVFLGGTLILVSGLLVFAEGWLKSAWRRVS